MTAGPTRGGTLPEAAYAAALAGLADVGPARLRRLLDGVEPSEAWAWVVRGHPLDLHGRWRAEARNTDLADRWSAMIDLDVATLFLGGPGYPAALCDDPEAPAVLFYAGDPATVDDLPRVGVVGTRSATRYGLGVAAQLGAELAAAGVAVVSGLAIGIDSASHQGAVAGWEAGRPTSAPPVAVVAGGLDRPYPASSAGLWRRVASAGVVLTECPIGTSLERWRFPKRNRIVAALSHVLVVVECHQRGGSLHTVRAATERGISVGAVPGSIRSPASAGTNDLLADGCFPVRDVTDVMVALALARSGDSPVPWARPREPGVRRNAAIPTVERGEPTESEARTHRAVGAIAAAAAAGDTNGAGGATTEISVLLLDAMGWEQCSIDQLLRRTGRSLAEVSLGIERLAAAGAVRSCGSSWERA